MYFAIISQDIENSLPLRKTARPAHLKRLEILRDENRLLIAGPFPNLDGEGFTGSLVVADFDTFQDAKTWADADPYVSAGVYESVMIKPYKKVLP
ncbi:MAG: YciI family protein [Magnetococcales bacterium]|nr:YciI family protein [Magnetococcales bacterium]